MRVVKQLSELPGWRARRAALRCRRHHRPPIRWRRIRDRSIFDKVRLGWAMIDKEIQQKKNQTHKFCQTFLFRKLKQQILICINS